MSALFLQNDKQNSDSRVEWVDLAKFFAYKKTRKKLDIFRYKYCNHII